VSRTPGRGVVDKYVTSCVVGSQQIVCMSDVCLSVGFSPLLSWYSNLRTRYLYFLILVALTYSHYVTGAADIGFFVSITRYKIRLMFPGFNLAGLLTVLGSASGSAGSACFWASQIRIRWSEVRIWLRIHFFSHKGVERTEIMLAK
jgi:hypothetical protein